MRVCSVLCGFALFVAALALAWRGGELADAANVGVTADNFMFAPATTTIVQGDTVTWTFADAFPHSVTADGGAFDSGPANVGGTVVFTFNTAGSFAYYCIEHGAPGGGGMAGTINVQAAPTATATFPPPPTNTSTNTTVASATSTATPTGTITPATATATPGTTTATPVATATTVATIVPTEIAVAPISATQPSGGAVPSIAAPPVGDGSSAGESGGSSHALSIALAGAGAVMIAAAALARRRS